MSVPTDAQAQAWMVQWRAAAPVLARQRAAELEQVNLWQVAEELEDAFWISARAAAAARASGLVEQQRLFARARPR
ncbi:MAG: hypothetical protein IT357_06475 [Gemmatimonadaceae bacterium]|nr:hypothetical protein [Gemmatimonadaceae bacterium]